MTSIKDYCERCGNYGTRLRQVDGNWLCRECRKENKKFYKPEIPFRLFNPFVNLPKLVKREIRKRRKRK